MQRYFQLSCHALIASAFCALAFTGRLDFPSIFIFAVALAVSCYRTIQGLPAPLGAGGGRWLSAAYVVFFAIDAAVLSGSFIPASIHLVLFLQLAKLFQEKSDRDYFYLIVLSFLQILAASSLTIHASFVATLFLFLIALVSTLMSFEMHRSEREASAGADQFAAPLGGMSVWAAVCIAGVGFVLFLVIPRIGAGYFTRATTPALLVSGFTDTVQLGEIGQVKLSSAVVMHARQLSGAPFAVLKWRGIALDRFDGRNWFKTNRERFPLPGSLTGYYSIGPMADARNAARYEILLEPLATTTLFGPRQVRAVSGRVDGLDVDRDDSIYLRFPAARRIQYEVLSEIPGRRAVSEQLTSEQSEAPVPAEMRSRYLQLPRNLDPKVENLAREITAKGRSSFEKALLVESYLKRNYRYTLDLTWPPGPQPLSTFLFQVKAGHCEYFASSMAILLRAAGVPTRIVNGFLMGEYNPVGNDYIVRESDAHTWVEAYIPGGGWMEFDPTPPDPNQRDADLKAQLSNYVDALDLFWNSYVLVYDSTAQIQLFHSAQDWLQSARSAVLDHPERWVNDARDLAGRAEVWAGLAGLAAAAAGWKYRRALRTQFQIWRIHHGKSTAGEEVIDALFYRAARFVEAAEGRRRSRADTWREWTAGLSDPRRRSILERALAVFEKSKYGRLPASPEEFAILEQSVRELRDF